MLDILQVIYVHVYLFVRRVSRSSELEPCQCVFTHRSGGRLAFVLSQHKRFFMNEMNMSSHHGVFYHAGGAMTE